MKNKLFKLTASLMIAFLAACSTGETPTQVTEKFLKEINHMNFTEAKKLSTEETGKMLDMMSSLMAMSPDKSMPEKKFEIVDETINGDEATVKYKPEGQQAVEFVKLIKKDGKWLVSVSKEDMAAKNNRGKTEGTTLEPAVSDTTAAADVTK